MCCVLFFLQDHCDFGFPKYANLDVNDLDIHRGRSEGTG